MEQTSAVPNASTQIQATGMWNQAMRLSSPSPIVGGIRLNAAQITAAIQIPVRYFHQLMPYLSSFRSVALNPDGNQGCKSTFSRDIFRENNDCSSNP